MVCEWQDRGQGLSAVNLRHHRGGRLGTQVRGSGPAVTISTTRFIRKPLYVDAVQITKKNFVELANWCQGEIRVNESDELINYDHSNGINPEAHHIRIRVHN